MARHIVTGIDIGTHHVKVVVAEEQQRSSALPTILASVAVESRGVRHGYIQNPEETVRSVRIALREAEKRIDRKITRAYVSVGGVGLTSFTATGAAIISRADSEITALDIEKSHEACEQAIPSALSLNHKILHSIPLSYKLDGKQALGKIEGMKTHRLEVKMLYIACLEAHVNEIISVIEGAGVEVIDVMAAPLASSFITLSKTQKIAGCVLANIGAETTSIAVFENNIPVSLEVFALGSTDITNDIALGLKVSLEEAEHIKIGTITSTAYPRKKLEEIIQARTGDIFDAIENHLKKLHRNGLLPAGIVLIGGGSYINGIEEMARTTLKLPARRGEMPLSRETREIEHDTTWAVAYGLCILGLNAEQGPSLSTSLVTARKFKNNLIAWIKQFLP